MSLKAYNTYIQNILREAPTSKLLQVDSLKHSNNKEPIDMSKLVSTAGQLDQLFAYDDIRQQRQEEPVFFQTKEFLEQPINETVKDKVLKNEKLSDKQKDLTIFLLGDLLNEDFEPSVKEVNESLGVQTLDEEVTSSFTEEMVESGVLDAFTTVSDDDVMPYDEKESLDIEEVEAIQDSLENEYPDLVDELNSDEEEEEDLQDQEDSNESWDWGIFDSEDESEDEEEDIETEDDDFPMEDDDESEEYEDEDFPMEDEEDEDFNMEEEEEDDFPMEDDEDTDEGDFDMEGDEDEDDDFPMDDEDEEDEDFNMEEDEDEEFSMDDDEDDDDSSTDTEDWSFMDEDEDDEESANFSDLANSDEDFIDPEWNFDEDEEEESTSDQTSNTEENQVELDEWGLPITTGNTSSDSPTEDQTSETQSTQPSKETVISQSDEALANKIADIGNMIFHTPQGLKQAFKGFGKNKKGY